MIRVLKRLPLTIALAVLISIPLAGIVFCQASMHVPRMTGAAPRGAVEVSIIAADQARGRVRLDAWWMRAEVPNGKCVLVLHGIGDSRVGSAGFAPIFLTEGYAVLTPDSRAHGTSEGSFVTFGLLERYDTLAWVRWMRKAGCRRVYGLGESLGASVLIQAAAVEPAFAAIVAEGAFADLEETARDRVGHTLDLPAFVTRFVTAPAIASGMLYGRVVYGLDFGEVSPVRDIARAKIPILLIHGLKDDRTPPSNSIALQKANPADPLWLVPGAGHVGAESAAPEEFRERVLGWFARH